MYPTRLVEESPMRRKMLGALCLLVIGSAGNLAAQPQAVRRNPALDQLRSGVWAVRGESDSYELAPSSGDYRLIAAGWEPPQLTPPDLSRGSSPEVPRAPRASRGEACRGGSADRARPGRSDRIGRLRGAAKKARNLRNAASLCDADIASGRPYSNVSVEFDIPAIPRVLSAGGPNYAGQFESVAMRGSERQCADFGGPRFDPADEPSRNRADAHYQSLCERGDSYACNARQIEALCFDTSPINSCVRDCLVTKDEICVAGANSDRAACRIKSHFQCYYSCGKPMPDIPEGFCVYQLPGWRSFR